jgi:hypothetical protein
MAGVGGRVWKEQWRLRGTTIDDNDHRQIADGMGMALRHPVLVLSCTAILLAAATGGPGGSSGGGLAAVNNNYAPGKAGNDVRGDAWEVQCHGSGGKYNNQLKRRRPKQQWQRKQGRWQTAMITMLMPTPMTAHQWQWRGQHTPDVPRGGDGGGDVSGGGGSERQRWATDKTWDIDLLCNIWNASTFQVNFMYEKFL